MKTVACIAYAVLAVASATAQSSPKSALTPIYDKMDSLGMKKDIAGMVSFTTKICTKDCVFIQSPGQKKKVSELLADMKSQMAMIDKVVSSKTHIVSTTVKGSTVVAKVSSVMAFTTAKGPDGKVHRFDVQSVDEDTWVKSGSSYKLKISSTVKMTVKQDGKVVNGS
ncbi:MAG: hypothetical protein P4L46_04685 [Fimbriimonas sp.]|nr:hypothetical protein [Fimbriimonas sp.]